MQKKQEQDRQLKEKQREEEIRKAKEQRALAELGNLSISKARALEIYNKIDEFSDGDKRAIAMALKKFWERCGKWEKKKGKKTKAVRRQMDRIQKLKEILEES